MWSVTPKQSIGRKVPVADTVAFATSGCDGERCRRREAGLLDEQMAAGEPTA